MGIDRKRWSRLSIALGAAVAMGVAAAPVEADTSVGFFSAQLDNVIIGADGAPGKVRPMFVSGSDAIHPQVVLDLSELEGVATVDFLGRECRVDGKTSTCELPSGIEFSDVVLIRFRPAAGAEAGDTANITYTTSAEGRPPFEQKAKVTIADGPDFVVLSGGEEEPAALGDRVSVPVLFYNAGSKAGDDVRMIFNLSQGLKADAYSNCAYSDWVDAHGQLVECTFNAVVEPDQAYELAGGFGAVVGPTALGTESVDFTVDPIASAPVLPQHLQLTSKGGKELKLVPAADKRIGARGPDIDNSDNFGDQFFSGIKNTTDVSGVGASVSGQVGATVKAKIGLKNNGAASLDSFRSQEPVINFGFAVPAGVQVVTVPVGCTSIIQDEDGTFRGEPGQPGGTYYICDHADVFLGAGETFLLEFGVKIVSASSGTVSADIKTRDPIVYPDDKPANNTAAVTVTVTTPGSGGGGTLPITGRDAGLIAGTGAALLAVGTLMLFAAHRRRVVSD